MPINNHILHRIILRVNNKHVAYFKLNLLPLRYSMNSGGECCVVIINRKWSLSSLNLIISTVGKFLLSDNYVLSCNISFSCGFKLYVLYYLTWNVLSFQLRPTKHLGQKTFLISVCISLGSWLSIYWVPH